MLAILTLVVASALGRDLRCPLNLEPYDLAHNPHDLTKYYRCLPNGLLEDLTCPAGQIFNPNNLECFRDDTCGDGFEEVDTPTVPTTLPPTAIGTEIILSYLYYY